MALWGKAYIIEHVDCVRLPTAPPSQSILAYQSAQALPAFFWSDLLFFLRGTKTKKKVEQACFVAWAAYLLYDQLNCIHTVILHSLFMALEWVFYKSVCFWDCWMNFSDLLTQQPLPWCRVNCVSASALWFLFPLIELMQRLISLFYAWPCPCSSEQHALLNAEMILICISIQPSLVCVNLS